MKKFTCKKLLKAISFIILSFAFALNAHSQTWCPAGATWYYTDNSVDVSGYSKLTYTIDTLINSINCKKITHYFKGDSWLGPYSGYGLPFYTYEQNGVAYLYNNKYGNNNFDTLFNINAQIGDNWRFPLVDTACVDSLYFMKVLNTGTKMLNGFNLKWLYVKKGPYDNSGFNYVWDTITERLGNRFDDLHYSMCYNTPDEYAHGGLRCYSDDAFGLYSTGLTSPCDYLTGISKKQIGHEILKIYPNPAQSQITIEFELSNTKNTIIEIKNALGQTVKTIDNKALSKGKKKIEIDVSEFSKGLYFIQLQCETKIISTKFAKY